MPDAIENEGQLVAEISRGQQAGAVLDNPIYREAIDGLRDQLRGEWEASPARDTEGREKLWLAVNLLTKLEAHLAQTMQTGQMARMQLDQERSRLERLKAAW